MAAKFLHRPLLLPFPFTATCPLRLFHKPLSLCLLSTTTATATTTTTTTTTTVFSTLDHYGPSLRKGHKPCHLNPSTAPKLPNHPSPHHTETNTMNNNSQHDIDESFFFDESIFTRIYEIAALRVPSEKCSALESRLRGHLLNWPRIRNIARVPGDDIDEELKTFLKNANNDAVDILNTRVHGEENLEEEREVLSPVLYRDKLVKSFNSRGYVKFRNLAKLSRPKRRKKEGKENARRRVGKNEMVLVEVVEDEESEGEDMGGLLGEEFKGRKWRGPTRLLLLDERFANKGVEDMPGAIKAVLKEHEGQNVESTFELVKCKLTLFYSYWQMNEILEALLPEGMVVPSAFETVGHIAHLNLRDEHLPYRNLIAKVVLDKNKPKIQTVVNKIDAIHNDHRTMQLEVLAGNHSLVTSVVENGLRFHVDLATVYWNSRLATERQRLISCFTSNDVVCDVFAGVGPIAISAAKKVKYVYANDLNPYAVEYLERNCVLNKLERKVEVFNMDGRRFIDTIFAGQRTKPITHVVMNLPNDAAEFLDAFRGIFRKHQRDRDATLPKIHVYGFSKAQDPEFDFHERIRIALSEVAFEVEMRKVRLVAPGKWMLCASFTLPGRVVYANTVSFS